MLLISNSTISGLTQRSDVLYNRPYIYLSRAQADRFVDESTRRISRIYEHLWINGVAADGVVSALD